MKELPLTQGKAALVDDADFEWLSQWKWTAMRAKDTWYAVRKPYVGKVRLTVMMHRQIANTKDGMHTDHRDGNGLNNQRTNLRSATPTQNQHNRRTLHRRNTSGFSGVSWVARLGKWRAYIKTNGRQVHLGCFTYIEDARRARVDAVTESRGEFAGPAR